MDEMKDAGVGHNDPAAVRALEGIREYQAGVTKEQAGRDDAIAGIIKYGAGLIEGRGQLSDRAFGEWITEKKLDLVPPFNDRQERAAAQQIATISSDGSGPVRSFAGCPHSRPVDVMKWWREKYPEWLTEAYANAVGERAAILLRDHRDRLIERDQRFDGQGKKIITYPRAEVRYLPESLTSDVPKIVAGLQAGKSFSAIPVPDHPIIRQGASGSFHDKGLEGASHHAVIPNVNTVDNLREVWPRLSIDEKKLFPDDYVRLCR